MATLAELQERVRKKGVPPTAESLRERLSRAKSPDLQSLRERVNGAKSPPPPEAPWNPDVGPPADPDYSPTSQPPSAAPPPAPAGKSQGVLDVLRKNVLGDQPQPATPPAQAMPAGSLEQRIMSSADMPPQEFRALQLEIARGNRTMAEKADLLQNASAVREGKLAPDYVFSSQRAQDRRDQGKSVAKSIPRGAIETGATALSPFALGEKMSTANIRALVPRIQSAAGLGEDARNTLLRDIHRMPNLSRVQKSFLSRTVRDVQTGAMKPDEIPAYLGQAEASGAGRAQTAMRDFASETFPIPAEHEDDLSVQVGRGVGSGLAFLGTRALTGPGGLAAFAGSAGSGEAIERAIAEGATDKEAARAGMMGVAAGLTDMVPIEKLLKPIAHMPGVEGALYAIVRKGIEQGAIEATQEGVQQILQNLVAKIVHTPEQEWDEGVGESGLVGFLVGVLFGGAAGSVQAYQNAPDAGAGLEGGDDGGASQAVPPQRPPQPGSGPAESPPAPGTGQDAPAPPAAPSVPDQSPPDIGQTVTPDLKPGAVVQVLVVPTPQPGMTERDFQPQRIRVDQTRTLENGTVVVLGTDLGTGERATFDTTNKTLFDPSPEQIAEIQTAVIDEARRQARGKDAPAVPSGAVVDGAQQDTGDLGPAPTVTKGHGRTGTLPKRIARTEKQLESILNEADRTRTAPNLTKEQKAAAADVKSEVLARLSEAESQAVALQAKPENERGYLSFTVRRVTGAEVKFTLKPDPFEIERLRKRIEKTGVGTFYEQEPGAAPTVEGLRDRVQNATTQRSGAGANHVGFIADTVEGVKPASEPIRREDILRDLITGLGVPLYQGRIKSKKTLGFFRPHIEEVRNKVWNDIEVAAHEFAHLLDYRFPEIKKQWNPATKANKAVREELRGVSYDKTKLNEGFAEFTRLWATQKEQARAKAPKFYAWFEDFVARNAHGPVLRKAQEDMHAWFGQEALARARSKVGMAKDINSGLDSIFDRFRQSVSDDLHGIMRMEKDLTGGLSPVGAYETARLTRAKYSIMEGALIYGAPVAKPDGSHGFKGKGLQEILKPVSDRLDDFLMYAVGRSSNELMGQGREHLFTRAEIAGMLQLQTPEFKKAFEEYQTWNRAILDFAQAKNIINPDARRAWKRTQYLPFHRVGQGGGFAAVPGDWAGIKALTGGSDNLRDILGNMIGNAATLIDAALTNEARVKVAELAQREGGARFMAKIPMDERMVRIHSAEIEKAMLEALGVDHIRQLDPETQQTIDQIIAGMRGMVPLLMRGQTPFGRNVVAVLRGGKPEYYEVADPVLYRALTRLQRPTRTHPLMKAVMGIKRLGQASITLSIDFISANMARDTLMGWVMSRHGFKPIIDSARGMASRIKSDEAYKEFIANGGGFASYLVDESAFRAHLDQFYSKKGINPKTVLRTGKELLLMLERIADATEMSTRLGEYKQAIGKGEHPRHAAYSAREVSTDFSMRGDARTLEFLYDTVMFLKAAVVGMDRLYRGVSMDPNRGAIAAKTGLIALMSVALYAFNRDIPEYDELEDWDRDTHWHFLIPTDAMIRHQNGQGDMPPEGERYEHFRYPKIWEIGAVASIAERAYQRFLDSQPKEFAADAYRILVDTFRLEIIPQAVAPLKDIATNRISFIDRPIETQTEKELPPWARAGGGTSPTLRAYGEDVSRHMPEFAPDAIRSPKQVEALLRGYFGTWAAYGLMISDAAFFDDAADLRVDQYPVFRRFYSKTPARSTRHVTEFYDALQAATEARKVMRLMDRTYRPELGDELADSLENLEFQQLSNANEGMRSTWREMRLVSTMPTVGELQEYAGDLARDRRLAPKVNRIRLSDNWNDIGGLKRELLDLWLSERNALAKEIMQDVKSQRKGKP